VNTNHNTFVKPELNIRRVVFIPNTCEWMCELVRVRMGDCTCGYAVGVCVHMVVCVSVCGVYLPVCGCVRKCVHRQVRFTLVYFCVFFVWLWMCLL